MRIHGICSGKNEEDIVTISLEKNLRWFDAIYVFDNGSENRTLDIVCELAKRDSRVVPFKSEARPFRDSLRGEVFNAFRGRVRAADRRAADLFVLQGPAAPTTYRTALSLLGFSNAERLARWSR